MHQQQPQQSQGQQQGERETGLGYFQGSSSSSLISEMHAKRGFDQLGGGGGGRKKQRAPSQPQISPVCQVEGCSRDLRDSKGYHRRHRVCELHSKTPKNVVDGIEQRFCQQCSRFHVLDEFDDGKRSCRKRLAGHNERRRKPPAGSAEAIFASAVFNPGDFKQQQQPVAPPQPHLLDGSFLSRWPENRQQGAFDKARQQLYATISDQQQQQRQHQQHQEHMLYEFLKSHAMAAAATMSSAPSASCSASDHHPPQRSDPRGALSLLSAGQSSTTAASSSAAISGSSSVFSSSSTNNNINSNANNDWIIYSSSSGRPQSMAQIPQPMPATTSALDMLQNLPFLRG